MFSNTDANEAVLEGVIAYAQGNERVCPMPRHWHELYNIISPRVLERGSSGARLNWIPAGPMILGGWSHTSVEKKRVCLREHLEYAPSMAPSRSLPAIAVGTAVGAQVRFLNATKGSLHVRPARAACI